MILTPDAARGIHSALSLLRAQCAQHPGSIEIKVMAVRVVLGGRTGAVWVHGPSTVEKFASLFDFQQEYLNA